MRRMTLQQFFDNVSSAKQEALEEVWRNATSILNDIGLGHVEEAVENECRLSESAWSDLLAALDGVGKANLEEVMTEVFQDWIRSGTEIPDTPTPKGRAVDANRFLSWLDDQGVFASPFGKRRFLDDVREGSFPTPPPP